MNFDTPLSDRELLAANILPQRPAAPRDPAREHRALDTLIGRINAAPDRALQALVETVMDLCGAGSAGVSILEGDHFTWPAIAGAWAPYVRQGMPRDASPCGVVIAHNAALLFDRPHLIFPHATAEPAIEEILLVPLLFDGAPRGTLWALSHDEKRFDADDARVLERMGLVAVAIEATRHARERENRHAVAARDRVRNTLAVMRSLVRHADAGAAEPDAPALTRLSSRLSAYAEGALGHGRDETVELWTLVARLLAQRGEAPDGRVTVSGESVEVPVARAGPLALALHELLENARDHGALARADGIVALRWQVAGEGGAARVRLSWRESGGAADDATRQPGFGLELLQDGLPALLGGETELVIDAEGVRFTLDMPLS